ncbi:DUF5677 domain-containing protein [Dyadobacter sp. LHD-138]|uniref:DUF5677 domain-containing protein n=1 Tax=Dyadobacter sp. LHD-138 TaxID=3071413 RepID=UPI0027DFF024|nr:DUF5677 domain-containing protein [Dyadobacter sp. LHD-138]MDQ6482412.1 DUF5677 domain-containing protein [Dyadobacter sp. LHD-138]
MSSNTEVNYFFKPCKQLIPREAELRLVEHFNKYATKLDDVVNFGSQVLTWEVQQLKNEEYISTPLTLLRESLDLTDSCAILLSKGAADSAKILTRSLFELFLSIGYLCKADTKQRSYAYMVSSILDDIKYHNSVLQTYSQKNGKVKMPLSEEQILEIKELIWGKESLFDMPGYEDAYKYYCTETERRKRIKNNRKLENWYSYYDGPRNLRGLSAELGADDAYTFFYSKYSKAAHGNESFLGKMVSSGEYSAEMVQLRSFSDLQSVFHYIFMFSTSILETYLSTILPERSAELEIFRSWSRQEMVKLIKD